MHIKYKLIFTILITLFVAVESDAQVLGAAKRPGEMESIYPEISPIYMQKLVDTAIKYYPQLKVRQAQIGMANSEWKQANATWFETFTIAPSYVYNPSQAINLFNSTGASTNFFSGYQIAFSLNISGIFTRPYVIKKAKQAIDVAKYEADLSLITLKTQIKTLYTNYQLAKGNERQAVKSASDLLRYYENVDSEFKKGDARATLTILLSALNAYNAGISTKMAAEAAVLNSKYTLEELVGKRLEDIK